MTSAREEIRAILMEMQQGRCAVCPSDGPLVVDHDHETGLVRGLLCRGCNSREGKIGSGLFSTEANAAMLAYLADPPAVGFGWLWDVPDLRCNPERRKADMERAQTFLQTVRLPPLETPGEQSVPESPAEDDRTISASPDDEPTTPPPPRRRRREPLRPVSIEQAIATLQAVELPSLNL